MKKNHLFAVILFFSIVCLKGQDSIVPLDTIKRIYKIKIKQSAEPHKLDGTIFQLKDSSILFSNSLMIEDYYYGAYEISELYIDDILSIYSERGNHTSLGLLIGAVAGFTIGYTVGYVSEKKSSPSSYWNVLGSDPNMSGVGGGMIFAIPGGIIGGVVGSRLSKTPIKGSLDNYKTHKDKLSKYSINK